jgi:putative transposase
LYKKSTYNPNIHNRKSIRLKGYDYAQAGLYFITICCQNKIHRFGHIENATMNLNEFGTVAYNEWIKLSERFPNIQLDVFQIMPNHMHGIIELNVRAGFTPAPNNLDIGASARVAPTVGDIVGAYKSLVANGCLDIYKSKNKTMGKLWQRNYYEHIIRNEKAYHNISEYIIANPVKWQDDKFYWL